MLRLLFFKIVIDDMHKKKKKLLSIKYNHKKVLDLKEKPGGTWGERKTFSFVFWEDETIRR